MERNKKRVGAVVQARMGSTRLPGKVLKKILGRPMLHYVLDRLDQSQCLETVIVATTQEKQDDPIAAFLAERKLPFFRGSEADVLDRFYKTATAFSLDPIVRITADCPLIDPEVVDACIETYFEGADYVSNVLERTFPRGLDVEVFSYALLETAAKEAKDPLFREHVTPFFYTQPKRFSLRNVSSADNYSFLRWTVDTPADFNLIQEIIEALYPAPFRMRDIVAKTWIHKNSDVEQTLSQKDFKSV